MVSLIECNVLKELVIFTELQGAAASLDAVSQGERHTQLHTFLWLKHLFNIRGFKPFQSPNLSEKFNLATDFVRERKKFLKLQEVHQWLTDMTNDDATWHRTTISVAELNAKAKQH